MRVPVVGLPETPIGIETIVKHTAPQSTVVGSLKTPQKHKTKVDTMESTPTNGMKGKVRKIAATTKFRDSGLDIQSPGTGQQKQRKPHWV